MKRENITIVFTIDVKLQVSHAFSPLYFKAENRFCVFPFREIFYCGLACGNLPAAYLVRSEALGVWQFLAVFCTKT